MISDVPNELRHASEAFTLILGEILDADTLLESMTNVPEGAGLVCVVRWSPRDGSRVLGNRVTFHVAPQEGVEPQFNWILGGVYIRGFSSIPTFRGALKLSESFSASDFRATNAYLRDWSFIPLNLREAIVLFEHEVAAKSEGDGCNFVEYVAIQMQVQRLALRICAACFLNVPVPTLSRWISRATEHGPDQSVQAFDLIPEIQAWLNDLKDSLGRRPEWWY